MAMSMKEPQVGKAVVGAVAIKMVKLKAVSRPKEVPTMVDASDIVAFGGSVDASL